MRRFLIVTADDFGRHEAINEAVERAARAGILTAASLMVAAPAASDAVRRAQALPQLCVGLHLTLADGGALLPAREIPRLVGASGRFDDRLVLEGWRYFALPRVRRELEAEIRAQFAAFARTGLALDHVNAHKHLHLHPTVLSKMIEVGREFGAPPVRVPAEPLWFARRASRRALWAACALRPWLALMRTRLERAGIAHNDRVFGIAASGAMDESALLEILARLPGGASEIYLHPAAAADGTIAASMSHYRHSAELDALLSPRVREALERSGAERGGFRALAAASSSGARLA